MEARSAGEEQHGAHPRAEPASDDAGSDVLDVISEVESTLAGLRRAYADQRRAIEELDARRAAISDEAAALDQARAELERQRADAQTERAAIENARRELEQVRGELEQRRAAIDSEAAQIDGTRAELAAERERISAERVEIEALATQSLERSEQIDRAEAEIRQRQAELDDALARLESERLALDEKSTSTEAAEAELVRRAAELDDARESVDEARSELHAAKAALESQRGELEARAAALSENEAAQAQREAAVADRELAIEAQRVELEALRDELDERRRELDQRAASLEDEAGRGDESRKLAAKLEATEKARADAEAKLREVGVALKQQLENAVEAEQERQRQAAEIDALEKQAGALAVRIQELEAATPDAEVPQDAHAEALESLTAERDRLARELASLRSAPDGGPAVDTWNLIRRERLRKLRALLRAQSDKIRRASDVLRERYEQCEQVLGKRAELAKAFEVVRETESKLRRQRARTGVVWVLTGAAALVGLLASLSWIAAERVSPGVYAARAVIEAETSGRTVAASELAEWQRYHESLLTDPRFLETAADRMRRRGIASLGSPGQLAEVLRVSLDAQSPRNGRLELELRGEGAGRTERILDTYVVALASAANASRSRRADGTATAVTEAARALPEPIDSSRAYVAASILGLGTIVALVGGLLLWRRMTQVKTTFELQAELESVLDESQWEDVPNVRR